MFVDTLSYGAVDVAVYVPMGYCFQLVVACASGLSIWEDWRVIDAWTAYAMVYTLMFLGVYELSNIDLVRGATIRYLAYQGELSSGKPHTPMGKALLQLQNVWRDAPTDEDKTSA